MQDTQIDAWNDIKPTLADKRRKVLAVIVRKGKATAFQVSDELGWPINRVSGRITELRRAGLIEDSGERPINPISGKKVIAWQKRVVNED